MSLHPALVLLGGLVVITLGAEMLLRGASRIAAMLGVKPILIGLTIVSVGTSTPELAVGIAAARDGISGLAVANVAGTNMFNILVILALSAVIRPLPLHLQSIKLDVPVMILAAIALFAMGIDGVLTRIEGIGLVCASLVYLAALIVIARRESAEARATFAEEYSADALRVRRGIATGAWNALLLVAGIALTILGAELLVAGASDLARALGVSDAIIGLTIVAIGTSAPELATTIVATYKNERDVAVGNLIGSSITNILVILGITVAVAPDGVDVASDVLWIDLPLGAATAIACYPVFRSDQMITRREGVVLLLAYFAYMATIVFVRA